MSTLGVLVGDALLPVREVSVVPMIIAAVKFRIPIPHVVKGMDAVIGGIQVGYIVDRLQALTRVFRHV